MRKTKIVCTMGPNANDEGLMRNLVKNGMNIARFNFSHGDYEEHKYRMDMLKKIREEEKIPVAILLDTKGVLKDGKKVMLEAGQEFTLTSEEIIGDQKRVSITYKGLTEDVMPGRKILIDDGLIELEVLRIENHDIVCRIINGGRGSMCRMYRYVFPRLQIRIEKISSSASLRGLTSLQHPLCGMQSVSLRSEAG